MEYKLEELRKLYKEILPRRYKRGLSNGMGTLIKDLTGNLDNQDLIDIQTALQEINTNQDTLNRQINKQIQVNEQIITRLQEIQNFVNTNLNKLQSEYNKTSDKLNHISLLLLYDQHFYKINHLIDILHNHLENLLDIITFSKQRLFSRHLLTENETQYIVDLFKQDNVVFQNDNFIYDLLELKGFFDNQNRLIYIIKIPIFKRENFEIYQIKSIPHINKILYPKPPNMIILNTYSYQYDTTKCREIYNTHYCQENQLEPVENSCTPAIIMQQQATCMFQNISNFEEIDYMNYGKIYVQPDITPITYTSTCDQTSYKIQEPTLIDFKNCEIIIKNQTFSTKENEFHDHFEIKLPYNDVKISNIKPELTLDILHNKTITNLEHTQMIHTHSILHGTSGHIALIIIILTIFTILIVKYRYLHRIREITSGPPKQPVVHLRGEELCKPTTGNITIGNINNAHDSAHDNIQQQTCSHIF